MRTLSELAATGTARPAPSTVASPKQIAVRSAAWFAAVPLILVHVYLRDEAFDAEAGLCAGALASLALLAVAYSRPRTLPVLAAVLTKLYVSGGIPVFMEPVLRGVRGPIHLSHTGLSKAMFGVLLLALCAILSSSIGRVIGDLVRPRLARLTDSRREYSDADRLFTRSVALTSIIVYAALTVYGEGTAELGSAAHIATILLSAPLPLALLAWDVHRTSSVLSRSLFIGGVVVYVLVGLGTGMLSAAVEPVLVAAMLLWSFAGRVPWITIISGAALAFLLNGAKGQYRSLAWTGSPPKGVLERADKWGQAITTAYSGDAESAAVSSANSMLSRVQIIPQIAQVMDWVPAIVPYAGPEVWLSLPLEFVPRVLWKDKPFHMIRYNLQYTLTFGIQHERLLGGTSIALPPVADGYWRLGWLGVVIEGILLGITAGFYAALFTLEAPVTIALGAAYVAAVSPELHVFGLLAGQPQSIIAIVATMMLIVQMSRMLQASVPLRARPAKR